MIINVKITQPKLCLRDAYSTAGSLVITRGKNEKLMYKVRKLMYKELIMYDLYDKREHEAGERSRD